MGDGCTETAEDSMLGVDAIEDARDESRLGMRSILDAALAPELLEPFSLTVSISSFRLPLSLTVLVDMERVRRTGMLEGLALFRFDPFNG